MQSKLADTPMTASASSASAVAVETPFRPWYRRGGMHVNEIGMGINIVVPPLVLMLTLQSTQLKQVFMVALLAHFVLAASLFQMRTLFCVIVVPLYMNSLSLAFSMEKPVLLLIAALALAVYKVCIPMSVGLHRYAAHGAFKCGPCTSLALGIFACTAIQGGPIWWATQHRMHHKFCDGPRDPHSCSLVGTEKAFAFFMFYNTIDEEFAPKHLESVSMRIVDTWSFVVASIELALAYHFFGREGLFLSYASSFINQIVTLWFNVCNHPPKLTQKCKGSDIRARPDSYYPAFWFVDLIYPLFGPIVQEDMHAVHHEHSTLAKRCWWDVAYWVCIKPMELAGLVWDVKVFDKEE